MQRYARIRNLSYDHTTRAIAGVAVIVSAMLVLPSLRAATNDEAVFVRVVPTNIHWGEISITEGPHVELRRIPEMAPTSYPLSVAISCSRRERVEVAGEERHGNPPEERRVGAVYLAAQVEGGRKAWEAAMEWLARKASTLTPETFPSFASSLPSSFADDREPIVAGSFLIAFCHVSEDARDVAGEARVSIKGEERSVGLTTLSDSTSYCASLSAALENLGPREILATKFDVRAAKEQHLRLRSLQSRGTGPTELPQAATVEHKDPPPGARAFESTQTDEGESIHEVIRPGDSGARKGESRPFVFRARTHPTSLDPTLLDGDVALMRWTWEETDRTFGATPSTAQTNLKTLDVAYVFVGPHAEVDPTAFGGLIAAAFVKTSEPLGIGLLARTLRSHVFEIGSEAVFTVTCDPTAPKQVEYCVGKACSKVIDPERFCDALKAKLD